MCSSDLYHTHPTHPPPGRPGPRPRRRGQVRPGLVRVPRLQPRPGTPPARPFFVSLCLSDPSFPLLLYLCPTLFSPSWFLFIYSSHVQARPLQGPSLFLSARQTLASPLWFCFYLYTPATSRHAPGPHVPFPILLLPLPYAPSFPLLLIHLYSSHVQAPHFFLILWI